MVLSGEKPGQLGWVMNRIAEVVEGEFDDAVKTATRFVELVMVVVIGSIIGFVVVAILIPIFSVGQVMPGGCWARRIAVRDRRRRGGWSVLDRPAGISRCASPRLR